LASIKIGPEIFIYPPFINCPKCGKEAFGVTLIGETHYLRRCKECYYPNGGEPAVRSSLPKLSKQVIYIDQFAICNMMKALNPRTRAYNKEALDVFWLRLFEKLNILHSMQLIVCPDSGYHLEESLLWPYFEESRKMYRLLSGGVSFKDHETIKRYQIIRHARNWLAGRFKEEPPLKVKEVVTERINTWNGHFFITFNPTYRMDFIEGIRRDREKLRDELCDIFARWQTENGRKFDDWFTEEISGFGKGTLGNYADYMGRRLLEDITGILDLSPENLMPPAPVILIQCLFDELKRAGLSDHELLPKVQEYLLSPLMKHVPFIKISAMLYAAIARKAAAGEKNPPNVGMATDIEILSVLLPYCDAIFIDKKCHSYLREMPLLKTIDYGTKVFSLHNKNKFMEYLDAIEGSASAEHLRKLDEVYGKTWREPYRTLYQEHSGQAGL
jgi:hypothetical protein